MRGFHVYKSVWIPVLGEQLGTQQEYGNPEDRYVVSVVNSSRTVGHMPREISNICWKFVDRGGEIHCVVTGPKQRSALMQGGLEIPASMERKSWLIN